VTEQTDLSPGPTLLYPLKALHTRMRSVAWRARGGDAPAEPGFRILLYHRVSDDRDELAVRPARFRDQMETLVRSGYRGVDVVTALEAAPGAVGLAFDDGYLDVAEHALPELERHGFTATVFVATGVTDGHVPLSWYGTQPPLLSWEDIGRLDGGALHFEAHTVTHPNLLLLDDDASRREITQSKLDLEARLGRPVDAFCYPAGLFGERERNFVDEAGYRVAVTCEPGVNVPGADLLTLRRRQIDPRDRRLDFRAKVGGGHDTPLPLRGVYRRLRYGEGSEPQPAATAVTTGR